MSPSFKKLLIRKCFLILMVILFTVINISFKGIWSYRSHDTTSTAISDNEKQQSHHQDTQSQASFLSSLNDPSFNKTTFSVNKTILNPNNNHPDVIQDNPGQGKHRLLSDNQQENHYHPAVKSSQDHHPDKHYKEIIHQSNHAYTEKHQQSFHSIQSLKWTSRVKRASNEQNKTPDKTSPAPSSRSTEKTTSRGQHQASHSKGASSSKTGNKNETATTKAPSGKKTNITTTKPLINLVPAKKGITCERPAYLEFPPDLFGQTLRKYGFVLVHIATVCYMFYCLAVVCDNYFLPSLEACAVRLHLSDDVAGATFMAAGSSAPELFTALLGVFIAKGDVGTGTIVGSAVFNMLFVIGLCGVFTASARLNWWPVLRDSSYYALSVFVLILCIYDGEVGTFESSFMLILYVLYIVVMKFNVELRELVVVRLPVKAWGLEPFDEEPDDTFDELPPEEPKARQTAVSFEEEAGLWGQTTQSNYKSVSIDDPWNEASYDPWSAPSTATAAADTTSFPSARQKPKNYIPPSEDPRKTSLFEAANRQILKHKRLFRPRTRFMAAANLIIIKNRKAKTSSRLTSRKKAGPSKGHQKRVISAVRQDTVIGGRKPSIAPEPQEWLSAPNPLVVGWLPVISWSLTYPLHAALYYTIPDCKKRPLLFLCTFLMSILWTAILSYVMVWMVVLIGFTFGIPDSVMGITFLAAGTSIPDAYASIHVARAGQADMAVSNSIGSNVFDILIGLALPWFLETAVVYPGTTATVKSMGLAYTVILLFLTLIATIGLIHLFKWTLNPKLGYSLLSVYALFLVVAVALEFNILGNVNPPTCEV